MTVEISILLAVLSGFVGLAGWFGGRDKRIAGDAEWRGSVNAKLDVIVGIRRDLDHITASLSANTERLAKLESGFAQLQQKVAELSEDPR